MKQRYPKYTHGFIDHDRTSPLSTLTGSHRLCPGRRSSWRHVRGRERWEPPQLGAGRTTAGTVNAAIISYYEA